MSYSNSGNLGYYEKEQLKMGLSCRCRFIENAYAHNGKSVLSHEPVSAFVHSSATRIHHRTWNFGDKAVKMLAAIGLCPKNHCSVEVALKSGLISSIPNSIRSLFLGFSVPMPSCAYWPLT